MGGRVFEGKTSGIKKEYIQNTLEKYFQELSEVFPDKAREFNLEHFKPIGSVGKKDISGDIDLAIDSSTIVDNSFSNYDISLWGLCPQEVREEYLTLKKRARTSTEDQLMHKAILRKIVEKINSESEHIYCDPKKTTNGNIFAYFPQYDDKGNMTNEGVQIDWMIGNMDWLQFSYYSSTYEGNVKGLHRTQLMLSMFNNLGLTFNHVNGVKDKVTEEVVAKTPKEAINLLSERYDIDISREVMDDYFLLRNLLEQSLPKKQYDNIIGIYFKILDSTRCDIPDDLQETWLKRKKELGLTGKFLNEDSKLKEKVAM